MLYGKTINLKGSNVTFNGSVDYDPAGSNQPEAAPRPESLQAEVLERLEPILTQDINQKLLVEPGFHLVNRPMTPTELKIELYGSEAAALNTSNA